jgi:hypothetical protein
MLRNIAEQRSSHLFRGERLKSTTELVKNIFFLCDVKESLQLMGAEHSYTQKLLVNV